MHRDNSSSSSGSASLDSLLSLPSLIVKQRPRGWFIEMCLGCEIENEYHVFDPSNVSTEVLVAREHSMCINRACCGNLRAFDMSVCDVNGKELLRFERPYHCRQGGLFCCLFGDYFFQVLRIYGGADSDRPGELLGWVKENYSFCLPSFQVMRSDDDVVYTIIGDCCGCLTYKLDVYDGRKESDESVGVIKKLWGGIAREFFTDADSFQVDFPPKSDATDRALLVGALFLIDFLYFEKGSNN